MTRAPDQGGAPGPSVSSPGERRGPPGCAVSVVVVNYESGPALFRLLTGLRREHPREIVVVDNGSTDGSLDRVRAELHDVVVVETATNRGYGAGANRGAAATDGPYVLVTNPDLEIAPGALAELVAVLDRDPANAAVGPLVRTPEGDRYPSARRFPSLPDAAGHALLGIVAPNNRYTRAYQRSDLDTAGPGVQEVDWVSGACFLVRRSAYEEVGGFDESYFMYAEDVDLCWRLRRRGWRVAYAPAAEVVHIQGVSTDRHPYRMIVEHHRSLWRFARRSQRGSRRLLLPLVAAGLGVRTALASADHLLGRRRPPTGTAKSTK